MWPLNHLFHAGAGARGAEPIGNTAGAGTRGTVLGIPSWILHIVWVIGVTVALLRGSSTVESRSVRYA